MKLIIFCKLLIQDRLIKKNLHRSIQSEEIENDWSVNGVEKKVAKFPKATFRHWQKDFLEFLQQNIKCYDETQ